MKASAGRILYLEDDEDTREMVTCVLSMNDYKVVAAEKFCLLYSVYPGATRTTMAAQPDAAAVIAASVRGLAIPRIAEPEEITRLVLFVASEASFSTGSEFIADGGSLLGPVPDASR